MSTPSTLSGWAVDRRTYGSSTYPIYRKGTGPGVIVIHEIPGITPTVIAFAEDVVAAGFTVLMPSLVGEPGKAPSGLYGARSMLSVCISKEFTTWARNRTSPVVAWLRQLARDLHRELGGPGVGALGMCFSGGFALAMLVEDAVIAPVISQPSLPFFFGGKARAGDLGISSVDLGTAKRRAVDGCEVMGLRYTGDRMIGTRFDTLRREFGDRFLAVEFPSSRKWDHSVLTEHRQPDGVDRVLAFLTEKLQRTEAVP